MPSRPRAVSGSIAFVVSAQARSMPARPPAMAAAVATARPLLSRNSLRDMSRLIISFPPLVIVLETPARRRSGVRDNPGRRATSRDAELEQKPMGTGVADVKLQCKRCVHGFVSEFLV